MRICFFTRADVVHSSSGGMESQGKVLTEGLVQEGHEVVLITSAHPKGLEFLREGGVEKHFLPGSPAGVYSAEWWEMSVGKFVELHCENKFDIVLSQSVSGWGYLRRKREFGIPCVAIMHGTTFRDLKTRWRSIASVPDFLRFWKEFVLRLWRFLSRWRYWFQKFDALIAVSAAVRNSLIKNYALRPGKVFLVYNGIEVEKFKSRGAPVGGEEKVVLYVGRLDREKGLQTLIEAGAALKSSGVDFRLVVVGGGDYYDELVRYAGALGLTDSVKFLGPVDYEQVPNYYQAADIFVLPSKALEGLPMTIIEAMAAGLPVIASDLGGIPEAVVDGEAGILVEPGNVEKLLNALTKLLTDDKLRQRMGEKASRIAREKFSQKAMVEGTLQVLRDNICSSEL